jgi:hypothetical protein
MMKAALTISDVNSENRISHSIMLDGYDFIKTELNWRSPLNYVIWTFLEGRKELKCLIKSIMRWSWW